MYNLHSVVMKYMLSKHNISVPEKEKEKKITTSSSNLISIQRDRSSTPTEWNNIMTELKRTISEGHGARSVKDHKKPDSVSLMLFLLSIVDNGPQQEFFSIRICFVFLKT